MDVTGDVDLTLSDLTVMLIDGFQLGLNQSFEILDVGGTLTGGFKNFGEGAQVSLTGGGLFISYLDDDGNDVVLYTAPDSAVGFLMLIGMLAVRLRRRAALQPFTPVGART